jgi:hypothetical protein
MPKVSSKPRRAGKSKLTKEELSFLGSQGIAASMVFDATGMSKAQYRPIMKAAGLPFAIGTPCQRGGHRLMTRVGHCIQCDTSKIAFMLRWNRGGYIYVAYSLGSGLTKVGLASDVSDRISALNNDRYAGACDWTLVHHFYCERDAGRIEGYIQAMFSSWKVNKGYFREGRWNQCKEVYECSPIDVVAFCIEMNESA